MSFIDYSDERFPRVDLVEAWPALAHDLAAEFSKLGRSELVEDARHLSIPAQTLDGVPEAFSFLAFSFPRLTREQRQALEFRVDEEEFELAVAGARVRVVLDNFGRINWLYAADAPDDFERLQVALRAHRSWPPT